MLQRRKIGLSNAMKACICMANICNILPVCLWWHNDDMYRAVCTLKRKLILTTKIIDGLWQLLHMIMLNFLWNKIDIELTKHQLFWSCHHDQTSDQSWLPYTLKSFPNWVKLKWDGVEFLTWWRLYKSKWNFSEFNCFSHIIKFCSCEILPLCHVS